MSEISHEAIEWAAQKAKEVAAGPPPKTRPLADFIADLKSQRKPKPEKPRP